MLSPNVLRHCCNAYVGCILEIMQFGQIHTDGTEVDLADVEYFLALEWREKNTIFLLCIPTVIIVRFPISSDNKNNKLFLYYDHYYYLAGRASVDKLSVLI